MSTAITPYQKAVAVTASDATVLEVTSALYVGVGGSVAVTTYNGDTVTFVGVPSGTTLPIAVTKVLATGTVTATSFIALYT